MDEHDGPLSPRSRTAGGERRRAARVWAPVLRGLLGDADARVSLRLLPDEDPRRADVVLAGPPAGPDEASVAALRDGLAGRALDVVSLEGVGRFVVERPVAPSWMGGRVALVTGAAQGFGRAIAEGLADRGCRVVLGDVQVDLASEVARGIEQRHGAGSALAVALDVTDEASFEAAVDAVVDAHGGLDLFVSNAGIVRAGGLDELTPDDFDLVTRVNYRGYFLGVRAVAPVLALQRLGDPSQATDVVEVNSKSGLAGSRRNFAYAGSKFGGIGLTQSFALELVGQGTKVNAVCPGNYLDGPLWTDPDHGLFVQYLAAGKVPGARTVDDVRRHYEGQVPMGRGCRPDDVVTAICYCVEQAYETGQAIPVTGGQTMLA